MLEMTNGYDEIPTKNICGCCGREIEHNEPYKESVYGDNICYECIQNYEEIEVDDKTLLVKGCDLVDIYDENYNIVESVYKDDERFYNNEFYYCGCCNDYFNYALSEDIDGDYVCNNCIDNYYMTCADCGGLVPENDAILINGRRDNFYVCNDCTSDYYCCEDCGEFFEDNGDMLNTNDGLMCNRCGEYYVYCEGCDTYYHEDYVNYNEYNDCYFCDSCYQERRNESILDYHEFDDWIHYRSTNEKENDIYPEFYIGFENEVECGSANSCMDTLANNVRDYFPVICSRDGSLDEGFEIVSHPFSYDYIMENKDKLRNMLNYLRDNNVKSHDTTTCGLHFHISKPKDEVIDRIWLLMETYKEELIKFSRRTDSKIAEWCKFLTDTDITKDNDGDVVKSLYFIKKNKGKTNRYMALNTTNGDTIEFRLFRGTLKFETFMASLELVNNIVKYCSDLSIELPLITWDKITETEYCKAYCLDKNIATNKIIIDNTDLARRLEEYDKTYKEIIKKVCRKFYEEVACTRLGLYKKDIKNMEMTDINKMFNDMTYNMEKISDVMYVISDFNNLLGYTEDSCLQALNKHIYYLENRFYNIEQFNLSEVIKKYTDEYKKIRDKIIKGTEDIKKGDDK